jgi:hypothetical protein
MLANNWKQSGNMVASFSNCSLNIAGSLAGDVGQCLCILLLGESSSVISFFGLLQTLRRGGDHNNTAAKPCCLCGLYMSSCATCIVLSSMLSFQLCAVSGYLGMQNASQCYYHQDFACPRVCRQKSQSHLRALVGHAHLSQI